MVKTGMQINALRGVGGITQASIRDCEQEQKKKIIRKGLEKSFSKLNDEEKDKVTEFLMDTQSRNSKIKINNEEISFDDLSISVAKSIQIQESETSPLEEYYSWLDEAQDVIDHMNDAQITDEDIDAREEFLDDLNNRENDIRLCISLYMRASDNPFAKKQLEFLNKKLARLMEIRNAVKVSTKNREEVELDRRNDAQERKQAEAYNDVLQKRNFYDESIVSDDEYKLAICCAQAIVVMASIKTLSEVERKKHDRYVRYLEQRRRDLLYMRNLAMMQKNQSYNDAERLEKIQRELARHQEIMNLVKVAQTPSKQLDMDVKSEEEDTIRRELCALVLECRRRNQDVPDRFLYRLGVKSFVPDYSAMEERLVNRTQNKKDVIERIKELSGRQTLQSNTKSETVIGFNSERFRLLQQKMRGGRVQG